MTARYMMENNYQYTLDLFDWCHIKAFHSFMPSAVYGKAKCSVKSNGKAR